MGTEGWRREVQMQIRDATETDIDAILEIYNDVLMHTTAIYNDQPAMREDRIAWWKARVAQGYPVLVAEDAGAVVGFASFGDFRAWPGYRFTVEGTVHIRSDSRGRGIGTALLHAIVDRARTSGKHVMMAGVDAENTASLRYLKKFGFERAGYLREVGFKFGRYLDLVFLQYWLTPPERPRAES